MVIGGLLWHGLEDISLDVVSVKGWVWEDLCGCNGVHLQPHCLAGRLLAECSQPLTKPEAQ
jgi:hypothetical protein